MSFNTKKIVPIIMAGGSGTRLWPYSRSSFPKQFQSLHGKNSLFQETILRLSGLVIEEPFFVVNEEHKFIAKDQIDELNLPGKIILEPESRNTAPYVFLVQFNVFRLMFSKFFVISFFFRKMVHFCTKMYC